MGRLLARFPLGGFRTNNGNGHHACESATKPYGPAERCLGPTMRSKAAIFTAPRRVQIREMPVRKPGPNEILVRLEGSGVCGSDLPFWQGRSRASFPQPPGAPGHEGWGIVSGIGRGVESLHIGDRVSGVFDGAFAETALILQDRVVKLPSRIDRVPFPGEPLACAMNAFQRSGIRAGETVLILGIGFLGAVLARLSVQAGAQVVAVSGRPHGLRTAQRMGVRHCLDPRDDVLSLIAELTGGQGCDAVVESTGRQEPLDLGAKALRQHGRLFVLGYHQSAPRDVDLRQWNEKGLRLLNAHARDPLAYLSGMQQAIGVVARQELDPSMLFTHRFGLHEIGDAFRLMEERPDGFLKAVVEC
jgi:2-desacetyl-2-hydroxyethyl bacteriochlorophyllide A dehydrogenase